MKHPQLSTILASLHQSFDRLYSDRLIHIILFGSQARNEAQPDSDIDILIVLKGNVDSWTEIKRTGEIVGQLCLDYSVVICCIFTSEIKYQTQQTALLRNVSQEGVIVQAESPSNFIGISFKQSNSALKLTTTQHLK